MRTWHPPDLVATLAHWSPIDLKRRPLASCSVNPIGNGTGGYRHVGDKGRWAATSALALW